MRLDHIVRLIESADPTSFREVAILYLKASGYSAVELTDGPRDAGSDLALYRLGDNPEPLAVQISVQKTNWAQKVRQDAQRARDRLGRQYFVYLTSRRIPNADAAPLVDRLWAEQGVTLRIIDSQAISSRFYTDGTTTRLLKALGIEGVGSGARKDRINLREDLAYSYAFFGADVSSFRDAALESSVAAFVMRADHPPTRDEITGGVTRGLKLGKPREALVASRIDAMTQRGQLTTSDGCFKVSPRIEDAQKAARTVRNAQWRTLKRDLTDALGSAGLVGQALERCEELVENAAGALMLRAAQTTAVAAQPSQDAGPAKQQMWAQLRRLESGLTNYGVLGDRVADLVQDLTTRIARSEFGQTLLAGEVFLSLLNLERSGLLKALGGESELSVFLDASVAIPVLASLLYEPHEEHFFTAGTYAYEQAMAHDANLCLPQDYLEEAASHLLDAWDNYRAVLDVDSDLEFSRNAFVAHFLALKKERRPSLTFDTYVRSFGLRTATGPTRSFREERDWIMDRMRVLFQQYGISIAQPGVVPNQALRAAQTAIAYTAKELGLERRGPLLDHDARAVADISARAAVGDAGVVFCTWDRLHLRLRTAAGPVEWNALDPVALGDLFALASPDDERPLRAALDIALEFGEAEARRGAEIWDELVRIEGSNLYDAELLAQAKDFKTTYLEDLRKADQRRPLAAAWAQWKGSSSASRQRV